MLQEQKIKNGPPKYYNGDRSRAKNRGKSLARWYDDLKRVGILLQMRVAHERSRWRQLWEAYNQFWVLES